RAGIKEGRAPSSTTRFFPDAERHKARRPALTKLEEEEGATPPPPATEEEMAPHNIWQVITPNRKALVFGNKFFYSFQDFGSEGTIFLIMSSSQTIMWNQNLKAR
ncbi:hypothetical protein ACJX0J_025743, partial [Zea mays]